MADEELAKDLGLLSALTIGIGTMIGAGIFVLPGVAAQAVGIAKGACERALQYAFTIPSRVRAGLFEPVMTASRKWAFYHPGIEVTRTRAQLAKAEKGEDPVARSRFGE